MLKKEVPSVTEADIVVAFPKFPGHLKFVVVENIVVVLVKLRNSNFTAVSDLAFFRLLKFPTQYFSVKYPVL